jgi:hypothetical protein
MLGPAFRRYRRSALAAALLAAGSLSPSYSQTTAPQPARGPRPAAVAGMSGKAPRVDYQRDIHAIFAAHCLVCHIGEERPAGARTMASSRWQNRNVSQGLTTSSR